MPACCCRNLQIKLVLVATFAVSVEAPCGVWESEQIGWEASIPRPPANGAPSEPIAPPTPLDFKILTSQTQRVYVTEAPEISDLPLVEGVVDVTIKAVEDPSLPAHPPPAVHVPNENSNMQTAAVTPGDYRDSGLVLVSATVYDHSRTLVTISPNGVEEGSVSAWSNVDFNHFSGFSTFRVTEENGSLVDYGLVMGLGNEEAPAPDSDQPQIPNLPDLSTDGPSFSVIQGDPQGQAMRLLTQLHELYRKEGAQLEAAFQSREKAHAERKAYLLANPQKPKDLVVHFWRGDQQENNEKKP